MSPTRSQQDQPGNIVSLGPELRVRMVTHFDDIRCKWWLGMPQLAEKLKNSKSIYICSPKHGIFLVRAQDLKASYAIRQVSAAESPSQSPASINSSIALPKIQPVTPRFKVCIAHHLIMAGSKLGRFVKVPEMGSRGFYGGYRR